MGAALSKTKLLLTTYNIDGYPASKNRKKARKPESLVKRAKNIFRVGGVPVPDAPKAKVELEEGCVRFTCEGWDMLESGEEEDEWKDVVQEVVEWV